jgi:hypothetical protein
LRIDQRRFDNLRLLRQAPAITDVAQLDPTGKEQLRVSRLAGDLSEHPDYSHDPKFTEAVAKKFYYGPMYLRRQSEPFMTLAVAGTRRDAGVTVVEVGLKLIWDVVSRSLVGERRQAYVIDTQNRLIAHTDISLVLRNTDLTLPIWSAISAPVKLAVELVAVSGSIVAFQAFHSPMSRS